MVVVGGGPVGLMVAGELLVRGVSVTVLERLAEPSETIKAGSISGRTVELLERAGLGAGLAELERRLVAALPVRSGVRPGLRGHFAGIFKLGFAPDELPAAMELLRLRPRGLVAAGEAGVASIGRPMMIMPQLELERLLGHWVDGLGGTVRRGVEVTAVVDDGGGVTVESSDGDTLRARYLVGCDGGRSTVRRLAGFAFPGTAPTMTGHQAIVELAGAADLPGGWTRTDTGLLVNGPFPGRVLTVEFDGPPADRDAPVTAAEVQASLRRVSGVPVTVTAMRTATRFTDNARLADGYRRGRVLLAGDAAHVHSPFGGQGLNLGLGDAANLGWKLAAVLAGDAGESLLDSYTAERHPVAARVLANTRAQLALLRPDPQSGALRALFAELMDLEQVNWHLTSMLGGLDVRYATGGHPLLGRFCPDPGLVTADGPVPLAELTLDGRGLLLEMAGDPAVVAAAAGHADRVRVISARASNVGAVTGLLVRPDGHVAWVADRTAPADLDALSTALTTWFGPAR
ncbi:FAD-dependent oxidoreductase [Actinocatenispora thailandica]|uniref:FAD-dependent oxidoreductase n=1 Tax=Actinocatenispora thailandica TaxID=227318 RepID=A0A7R7HY82_9ACTN|nr:FAD-dependent oxidoreductase [Actinocatenispora thailandica]